MADVLTQGLVRLTGENDAVVGCLEGHGIENEIDSDEFR
jgi:hypothetical protein